MTLEESSVPSMSKYAAIPSPGTAGFGAERFGRLLASRRSSSLRIGSVTAGQWMSCR